jgi:Ca2+-binding RTX toxin-like protein
MPEINGTSAADTLSTSTGGTVVHGLGGDDYIYDSWFFSDYADELYGDEGNDEIYAWGGNDLLFGGAGDDILAGGFGADTLDGGDDNDTLIDNQAGGDTLRGGAGDDLITVGHPTTPTLLGPLGSLTTIEGGTGNDRIDLVYSRTAQTAIDAGEGDDLVRLTRSAGAITITLGAGSDRIEFDRDFGGWPLMGLHITDFGADDRLTGLSEFLFYAIGPWDGVDNPFATGQLRLRQSGADTLLERNFVGAGDAWDTILSFDNVDAASLTAAQLDGFDPTGAASPSGSLDGGSAGEALYGGQGDDVIHGNDGDDILTGNAGDDALYGGEGADTLVGGVGTDLLDGGAGNDDFDVTANGADTVIGGDGDDTLFYRRDDRNFFGYPIADGTSNVDMGAGNDHLTIHNFAGPLIVDAGAGDDTIFTLGYGYRLTLGAGADSIQASFTASTLTVTDFNPTEDRFSSISGLLSTSGSIPADPYAAGLIRLVQQGADTAVQISPFFPEPYTNTAILLLGVDARSLNAANFGGYAPDGIWAFGTTGNDVLAGGSGIDRLSDDKGGSDSIDGGSGNDILSWSRTSGGSGISSLSGGAGDDRIELTGGNASGTVYADGGADNDEVHLTGITGRAVITLGAGQDRIAFDAPVAAMPIGAGASVTDFQTGAGGDALALTPFLSAWLTGWNGTDNPFGTGHVRLAQNGAATLLQFDRDGGGNAWLTALVLENTDSAALTAANLGGWESGTFGNRAPALAAGAGLPTSYVEGGDAIRLTPSATLADADSPHFAGGALKVMLAGAVADDVVSILGGGPDGIGVSGGIVTYLGTAIGTIDGGGPGYLLVSFNTDATAAAVQALVRDITYAGATDAMLSGPRTFTVDLTDGDGGTAEIVTAFTAQAVNDAPTIGWLGGDVAHFVEGGAAVRLDVGADALIGDADSADFAGGTLRVAITANGNPLQDMLGVEAGGRIGVFGNQIAFDGFTMASSVGGWPGSDLVFTFTSLATPEAVSLLIHALTYQNIEGTSPSAATRTVTLTLTDGDGTAFGGTDTRIATAAIEVAAINEAPQLSEPFEPVVHYLEDDTFAPLFGGVFLGDAEFRAGYGGGSLTLSVSGGAGSIRLPSWASFHAVAAGGGFNLIYDNGMDPAVFVGRIAGLGTASVIVDSFAAAPPNVFSYLISAFTYSEATGDAPSATPRTATITFNDGGNGNGVGALSASRTQTIEIVAQNDAPVLAGGPGGILSYSAGSAPALPFAGATIADPDQPASFAGGALELTTGGIGAGFALTGSRFAVQNGGGGETIIDNVSGLQIGIVSRGPGSLSIALGAGATPEAVTALARSIGFVTAGEGPSLGLRGVFMTLHDGGNGGAGGSLASNSLSVIVDVVGWRAGTPGNDVLTSGSGADYLIGFAGDDILMGNGAAATTMQGGTGDDWYYVSYAGDSIVEFAGEGADRVVTSVGFALSEGQEIETLVTADQAGTAAIALTGNGLAQVMFGNAGANALNGGGGSDYLIGLGGDDILIGNAATASTLQGGTGNDWYYVSRAGDSITEFAGEGNDRILTTVGYTLSASQEIETLSALDPAGIAAIDLTGNGLGQFIQGTNGANTLTGGGGADYLLGLGGNDILIGNADAASTLQGGTGDDWYYVSRTGDSLVEAAGEGNDRLLTSVSYTLSAGQEIETLSAQNPSSTAAIDLAGNDFGQFVQGTNGANILSGLGGTDVLAGLGGTDVLLGGDGDDVVNGGSGSDVLNGGAGADMFVFADALGPSNIDGIQDLVSGSDRIALDHNVFAGLATGVLSSGAFVTGTSAQDADDRILYDSATGALYYDADGNGAGAAVQFATLSGHPLISASDFVVI